MPSRGHQNKRQRDERYTAPERPSQEDILYLLWESSKQTSCVIADILSEIRAINRASISESLKDITKRLSKLESDVNTFDLPHQEMVDNFDHFRQQLANIQQEFMGCEFEQGQNPVFRGTLRSCLGDLGTQMGGITSRMGNVEDNLLKLEGRLFGKFDENINPESGYVMIKIHNDQDFRQKLKQHNHYQLTHMVQSQGGVWAKVDTVKLQEARSKGKFHFMIISFSDWDTGEYIRENVDKLKDLFKIEHQFLALPLTYHLHIVDLAVHQKMGYDYDMKKFVEDELDEPGVRAKVAYQRVILQTEHLGTAKRIALKGASVFGHHYEAKPYCAQGTPLFCNRCCKPNHFANDCNANSPHCGLCAEAHDTFTCDVQKDFKCCNCGGGHKAWDPCCTDRHSRAEHQKSLFYRNKVPQWSLNLEASRPSKDAEGGNGKTKASSQGSSSVPSSQESAKKPVGRPKKFPKPNPGQARITAFYKEPEPDAMELTTSTDDLEMNSVEVPCSQPDAVINDVSSSQPGAVINDESSNNAGPSAFPDDIYDYGSLFGEDMSTTGGGEEPEQSRPGSRLSDSSSTPSLNGHSTMDTGGNKKHSKKGKNGRNKDSDNGKGKENATTEPKDSTPRQKNGSTTPSRSRESSNAISGSLKGKQKEVAVEKDGDRARSSSSDLRRGQSRDKDIGRKRDSNDSRDRGRSSTRSNTDSSTKRTSSKAGSRKTTANSDSDSDSDNGHTKSGRSRKASNDKTRKPQQTGTPRPGNGTKSTPKSKASSRAASAGNVSVTAARTTSASRAPVGTPSKAVVPITRTSSAQPPDKRAGHVRSASGREKGGPSPRPRGHKKRKFSQGSAKGKGDN